MGHSHYWTYNTKLVGFSSRYKLTKSVIANFIQFAMDKNYVLANGLGDIGSSPVIKPSSIYFNGAGDDMAETMYFDGKVEQSYNYCKTNRCSYDPVVVASLLIAKQYMGPLMSIKSDGCGEHNTTAEPYFDNEEGVNLAWDFLVSIGLFDNSAMNKRQFIYNAVAWYFEGRETKRPVHVIQKEIYVEYFTLCKKVVTRRKVNVKLNRRRRMIHNKQSIKNCK